MNTLLSSFHITASRLDASGDLVGTLRGPCSDERPYLGVRNLLACIEVICDQHNYPRTSTEARAFPSANQYQYGESTPMTERSAAEQWTLQNGKATFVVSVLYRQNATWQGTVKWIEGGTEQKFRSALELIKLLDHAVDSSHDDSQNEN